MWIFFFLTLNDISHLTVLQMAKTSHFPPQDSLSCRGVSWRYLAVERRPRELRTATEVGNSTDGVELRPNAAATRAAVVKSCNRCSQSQTHCLWALFQRLLFFFFAAQCSPSHTARVRFCVCVCVCLFAFVSIRASMHLFMNKCLFTSAVVRGAASDIELFDAVYVDSALC